MEEFINQCQTKNLNHLTQMLSKITKISVKKYITIQLLCNWATSEQLAQQWNKMTKDNNYCWGRIKVIWNGQPDYFVVINGTNDAIDPKKTILFHMEPNFEQLTQFGQWCSIDDNIFLKVFRHKTDYNNNEWHLSLTYAELMSQTITKTKNKLSIIISDKYQDIGQIKRVDFVHFLEKSHAEYDLYGQGNRFGFKNHLGSLPYNHKEIGLFDYKYTLGIENCSLTNYYTEKLIDGILSECLTFYWGCPNIDQFLDPRAYVKLNLVNFEEDLKLITKAIQEDWHSQRLPYIKEAKKKILTELQFFPRLEKFILKEEERKQK